MRWLGVLRGAGLGRVRSRVCCFCVLLVACRWHERSDYMFFRNFHPNMTKLKENLVAAKGMLSPLHIAAPLL